MTSDQIYFERYRLKNARPKPAAPPSTPPIKAIDIGFLGKDLEALIECRKALLDTLYIKVSDDGTTGAG